MNLTAASSAERRPSVQPARRRILEHDAVGRRLDARGAGHGTDRAAARIEQELDHREL